MTLVSKTLYEDMWMASDEVELATMKRYFLCSQEFSRVMKCKWQYETIADPRSQTCNYRWCGALIIAVRTCMAPYVGESRAKIPLMYMASRTDLAELGAVIIMPVADESHGPLVQLPHSGKSRGERTPLPNWH